MKPLREIVVGFFLPGLDYWRCPVSALVRCEKFGNVVGTGSGGSLGLHSFGSNRQTHEVAHFLDRLIQGALYLWHSKV